MKNSTYGVAYLLRKTSMTLAEIRALEPGQFRDLFREVMFQESQAEYQTAVYLGSLLAAIANTVPRRKGSKGYTYKDFVAMKEPKRPGIAPPGDTKAELADLAKRFKIKLPAKEITDL